MLFRKKTVLPVKKYDLSLFSPVLRCSICTGEQTAGFKDNTTGIYHEIMLIRSEKDLEEFKKQYGVQELRKEY